MFEQLKLRIQERVERNTYKSQLSWEDKQGNQYTDEVLLKRSRIPVIGDWGRIYPPITEKGNIHWVNLIFGGWKNLFKLAFILGIIALFIFGYIEAYQNYNALINDTCVKTCINIIKP
jgi:hypothetical protein